MDDAGPPLSEDAITPVWLNSVMAGAAVSNVRRRPMGRGSGFMSRLVRLELTYDRPCTDYPRTLVVKSPARSAGADRMDGAFGHYERECRFYAELAAESPVRTPRPHFVAFEPGSRRFTLLQEDMAAARAGDQVAGLSASQAAEAVAAITSLHAHWWRSARLQRGWLTDHPGGATALEDTVRRSWPAYAAFAADLLTREARAVGEALTRALPALRRRAAGAAPTLVHGDLRADNILFGADPVCFVDWQLTARAPGPFDIAFLLTSSLTPAVRRAHEQDLLRDYHRRLVQAGIADYPLSECVADYRLGALIGWSWPIVGVGLLDLEDARGAAVFRTWAERMAAAASDLDLATLMD